jgi:hypothetical protein
VQSTANVPGVHKAATLTESALLSGTAAKDRASDAQGGLLNEIGSFGILMLKDFGSVLNEHRDKRGPALAALRECFDGSWTRHVGVDGGRTLHWEGKLGLIAGCTPTIDRHHSVMAAMGERFLLYRLPMADASEQAGAALSNDGQQPLMRRELANVVAGLFASGLQEARAPSPEERRQLITLSTFVVRCRSAVERDGHTREIELVSDPESPARLVLTLSRLLAGLDAIGAARTDAWGVVTKCALDSMPALRLATINALHAADDEIKTGDVATAIRHPTVTVRRTLEDLDAHDVAERHTHGKGTTDTWTLSTWAREHYAALQSQTRTVSEKSGQTHTTPSSSPTSPSSSSSSSVAQLQNDISGTVPPEDLAYAETLLAQEATG